jgi:hypothetical protein
MGGRAHLLVSLTTWPAIAILLIIGRHSGGSPKQSSSRPSSRFRQPWSVTPSSSRSIRPRRSSNKQPSTGSRSTLDLCVVGPTSPTSARPRRGRFCPVGLTGATSTHKSTIKVSALHRSSKYEQVSKYSYHIC